MIITKKLTTVNYSI